MAHHYLQLMGQTSQYKNEQASYGTVKFHSKVKIPPNMNLSNGRVVTDGQMPEVTDNSSQSVELLKTA